MAGTTGGDEIHIEGDDAGLRKLDADLEETFEDKEVSVEYDRDERASVEIDDSE